MTDKLTDKELIERLVSRFLNWRLPADFSPDAGISFKPMFNEHTAHPMRHEPTGTNLFDAKQATEMVRYMLEGTSLRALTTVPDDLAELVERLRKRQVLGNNQGAVYLASEHDDLCVEAANAIVALQVWVATAESLTARLAEAKRRLQARLPEKYGPGDHQTIADLEFIHDDSHPQQPAPSEPAGGEGWRTMESAPKDGTIIIVPGGLAYWRGEAGEQTPIGGCTAVRDGWYTLTAEPWPGKPIQWPVTHWRPLPEPPPSPAQEGK